MITKNHVIRSSEDIIEEMIDYCGKKENGLVYLRFDDIAPALLEEYCTTKIREGKFDGECVVETDVTEMLLGIMGKQMDRECCYEMIEDIKYQMILYYRIELEDSIEKHLREVNFPEEEVDIKSSTGWSAIYWAENPPKRIVA
jgi:hypothetical protein